MTKSVFEELQGLTTEQRNPATMRLDTMSVPEILLAMNEQDRTVPERVAAALPDIEQAVNLIVPALQRGGRLIYVGAGTSGRLGVLDAAECPPTFGTEPWQVQGFIAGGYGALVKAVEGAEDNAGQAVRDLDLCSLCANDVVCGITASRRTPYVISSLQYARERGSKTVFIICNDPPPPTPPQAGGTDDFADVVISVPVGPEALTGSTRLKAGTATKLVLNMLTTASMVRLGKCYENLMVDLRTTSEKLKARMRRILMDLTQCDYEWADALMKDADGELKTALVMHWKNVGADRARELLEANGGVIRRVIEGTHDAN
ncbi:MAG TPA: N-acetylmuramic acid 6-phosphate etherase [bacterium]|jgi:N-acetylmuramic acid 6-phosphate etherase